MLFRSGAIESKVNEPYHRAIDRGDARSHRTAGMREVGLNCKDNAASTGIAKFEVAALGQAPDCRQFDRDLIDLSAASPTEFVDASLQRSAASWRRRLVVDDPAPSLEASEQIRQ